MLWPLIWSGSAVSDATVVAAGGIVLACVFWANLWAAASSWIDYACLWSAPTRRLFCGNFGILAKRTRQDHGLLPSRFRRLAVRLGEATDVRGQQAGGLAVMSLSGRFVGREIVNDKRGDLTRDFTNRLAPIANLA